MIYYDSSLYIPGFILIWTYIRTDGKTFLPLWSITVNVCWNDKVSKNMDLRHGLFLPSGTYFGHCSSIISNKNCSKIDFIHLHLPQKFPPSPGFPGFYIEILSFYWKNHWEKKRQSFPTSVSKPWLSQEPPQKTTRRLIPDFAHLLTLRISRNFSILPRCFWFAIPKIFMGSICQMSGDPNGLASKQFGWKNGSCVNIRIAVPVPHLFHIFSTSFSDLPTFLFTGKFTYGHQHFTTVSVNHGQPEGTCTIRAHSAWHTKHENQVVHRLREFHLLRWYWKT